MLLNGNSIYEVQRKLLPEMDELLKKRYRLLQTIALQSPIGRRALADILQLTERDVRKETQVLSDQQLIHIQAKGMVCTEFGYTVLEQLKTLFHELTGISKKEQQLKVALNINKVIIVHGDIEQDVSTYSLIGKEAATVIMQNAKPNCKIAVTGGTSVGSIGAYLQPHKALQHAQFIAARGGIGDEITMQANTLVAQFAEQCHATYRTLFLPEHLSEQAYSAMKDEPIVKEMIELYDNINIVIHGIGEAMEMADRRQSSEDDKRLLREKGAIAEAFGYYFDEQGQIVHHIRTIGIQLEQVQQSDCIIAIAAGASKAKSVQAYFKNPVKNTIFITDESAANAILKNL